MERKETANHIDIAAIIQLLQTTECKEHPKMHVTDMILEQNKLLCFSCKQERLDQGLTLTNIQDYFSSSIPSIEALLAKNIPCNDHTTCHRAEKRCKQLLVENGTPTVVKGEMTKQELNERASRLIRLLEKKQLPQAIKESQ